MIDILISFRDRHSHLEVLVPELRKQFQDMEHNIVVIEQANDFVFYKSILYNVGIQHTEGDTLIFHDVDYIPDGSDIYFPKNDIDQNTVYLPVYDTTFVNHDFTQRAYDDIPSGYRHFTNKVDDNFYGGVIVMSRNAMNKIGGFNPYYMGWGLEDAEIYRRVLHHGLIQQRMDGHFFVLPHTDNNKGLADPYYQWNEEVYRSFDKYVNCGWNSQQAVTQLSEEKMELYGVDGWIEVLEAEVAIVGTDI